MKRWFDSLPVHRKLVVMALLVTGTALFAATFGLTLFDIWRYRDAAAKDITSLAQVIAENTEAAVVFKDAEAASQTLATARVRPFVTRACIYFPDGSLFEGYNRPGTAPCDRTMSPRRDWRVVSDTAPVLRNGRQVGIAYAERDLSDLGTRIAATAIAGLTILLLAALLAYPVAQRVHRTVSAPIAQLATAARSIGTDGSFVAPGIHAGSDEVGELVRAFTGMVNRVREANESLQKSNEALTQEVEERRRVEREREALLVSEREANRVKDEFLAAVSHELRTPLNAILGWVQILAHTAPTAETQSRAIASIARNAHVQTRVIEDLIDVSRIATGKLTLRREAIDLRATVEAAVEVLRSGARAKQIDLSVRVPGTVCAVNGDSDRLQQVVWNLVSNAVKFTPESGSVRVTLQSVDSAYEIRVTDTGIGIPQHFLGHVFDRFRQADGSMTREHGGLGLGLAIVKELTELHGGSVGVLSAGYGQGSTFLVRIPALAAGHPPLAFRPCEPVVSTELSGVCVLAVDDNADALEIAQMALRAAGADVRVVCSGGDAIREWDRVPADVLICDLAMPDMTGFDVLRQIRSRNGASGRPTRAIALSAHASQEHMAQCREAGFDQHLSKPCNTDDLVRAVAVAVDRS